MAGNKTHEQQIRTFERKDDHTDEREAERAREEAGARGTGGTPKHPGTRQSEYPVSRGGMNQESPHNKHNDGGQQGHEPQPHNGTEQGD